VPSKCVIIAFFGANNPYKKIDEIQQQFFKDLILYICKGYKALSSCENVWLQRLILQQCTCVIFPFHFDLVEKILIIGELFLFRRLCVIPIACVHPPVWWRMRLNSQMLISLPSRSLEFQDRKLKLNMCSILLVC
jgi:hypothetical protein